MRRELILIAAAALFGLAGGYAWTALTAVPAKGPKPAKSAMVAIPPSPEEEPLAPDQDWTAQADDGVHYSGCNEVRAGKAPLYDGQPGYSENMDGDGDGIACEPIRHP